MPHAALLAVGNDAAAVPAAPPSAPLMTARRRGMRRGAKIMFFCAVLLPAAALLAFEGDAPGPLLLVLTGGLAGLLWLVYSWLFNDNVLPVETRASRKEMKAARERAALGSAQFVPASSFSQPQRGDTAEIYQPPSVTENTTKLLDKDS